MKKIALIAIFALLVVLFTGCSADAVVQQNGKPSVVGVKDFECIVNTNIDFLDGVAALDYEDGDITDLLEINVSPEVQVNDGWAYFSQVGEYEVNYKITDSDGNVATKRSYVDVVDRETYMSFKMPNGFSARTNGNARIVKSGMENGAFKLHANGGEVAEDVMLDHTYSMICGYQYTFTYVIDSSVAGKVKVLADGVDCAELAVKVGENRLVFEHTANKVEDDDEADVEISVCFGCLGDPELTIKSVDTEYFYPENMRGKEVERAEDFNFAARVTPRIDDDGGNIDLKGNAWSDNDGKEACLEITSASDNPGDIWRGGMFINTGIALKKDTNYNVSFDISAETEGNFEVVIQNKQWDEHKFTTLACNEESEHESASFNVEGFEGSLWIYVQSGANVNTIRLSNLSVKETLGESEKQNYPIEDFVASGEAAVMTTEDGGFVFNVSEFAATDNAQQVTSPSFFIAGSSANYVVTFKAKASAPIELIIAAPVYGGAWDPTIMWERIYLTDEEQAFTFFCNGNASDMLYMLVWQFGSVNNQRFSDVTIEISEIKISLRNGESDV